MVGISVNGETMVRNEIAALWRNAQGEERISEALPFGMILPLTQGKYDDERGGSLAGWVAIPGALEVPFVAPRAEGWGVAMWDAPYMPAGAGLAGILWNGMEVATLELDARDTAAEISDNVVALLGCAPARLLALLLAERERLADALACDEDAYWAERGEDLEDSLTEGVLEEHEVSWSSLGEWEGVFKKVLRDGFEPVDL